jgi:hypothetical protein
MPFTFNNPGSNHGFHWAQLAYEFIICLYQSINELHIMRGGHLSISPFVSMQSLPYWANGFIITFHLNALIFHKRANRNSASRDWRDEGLSTSVLFPKYSAIETGMICHILTIWKILLNSFHIRIYLPTNILIWSKIIK